MPLTLFNFPHIDLKGYVVRVSFANTPKSVSYRYSDADFLSAREKAVQKALEMKKQMVLAGRWNAEVNNQVELYLEYAKSRPEEKKKLVTERIYLLNGVIPKCDQLLLLDLECAHLMGAEKKFPKYELDCNGMTYVAVYSNLVELLNFYNTG